MRLQHSLALATFSLLLTLPTLARADDATSILDKLTPDDANTQVDKAPDGIRISSKNKKGTPTLHAAVEFKTPVVITAQVKTDSKSIRLYYADKGRLILNWEDNGNELRYHDPITDKPNGVPNKGTIPKNTFVTIRWTIDKDQTRVEVDGVERATFKQDHAGLSGTVGIGTYQSGVITVKSLTVQTLAPSEKIADKVADKAPISIDVKVPAAKRNRSPGPAAAPADPSVIERPEFQNFPKPLIKSIASVTALVVRTSDDGETTGFSTDIIANVPAQSRTGDTAGAGFYRVDGDESMKTSFEEAVRAVTLRYPLWEPGHIDFSFGEKFQGHGGPSAGTAFALLMLSSLEGFDIDPKCAVTGDITVDWKVRKIGGAVAKIRGAALDQCLYAAIPEANAPAIADMAILNGHSSLWDIQILSISTLQEAEALVRKDRPAPLAEALKSFAGLVPQLAKNERAALQDKTVHATLQHIVELAPNHLSARQLLATADGTAPKTLSAAATYYNISLILYPYRDLFEDADKTIVSVTVPPALAQRTRQRLDVLRPIADKELQPVLTDIAAFVETANSIAMHATPPAALKPRLQAVAVRLNTVSTDPEFVGKLARDGY